MVRSLKLAAVFALLADLIAAVILALYVKNMEQTGSPVANPVTGQTIALNAKHNVIYVTQTQVYIVIGLAVLFAAVTFNAYVKLVNSRAKR